jgi:hypothetical protein
MDPTIARPDPPARFDEGRSSEADYSRVQQAQPGPFRHVLLAEMHESPQGWPLEQYLQQLLVGAATCAAAAGFFSTSSNRASDVGACVTALASSCFAGFRLPCFFGCTGSGAGAGVGGGLGFVLASSTGLGCASLLELCRLTGGAFDRGLPQSTDVHAP